VSYFSHSLFFISPPLLVILPKCVFTIKKTLVTDCCLFVYFAGLLRVIFFTFSSCFTSFTLFTTKRNYSRLFVCLFLQRSKSNCTECPPCQLGHYSDKEGAVECEACLAGSYSDTLGSAVCHPCHPGQYNNQTGSSSCTNCLPGSHSHDPGSVNCTLCRAGNIYIIYVNTQVKTGICNLFIVHGILLCLSVC